MSADSAVTYTSVHSEARSWSIPSEDPYEEAAQQLFEQAPRHPEYVPENHIPVYIPEPEHPEDLVPAEDLHPSGTPPVLPILYPAPYSSRRAMFHEVAHAQKRTILTTPRPGCEIGESSAAAAARQPGPTIETRLLDTERRMMTALELVNRRISYQDSSGLGLVMKLTAGIRGMSYSIRDRMRVAYECSRQVQMICCSVYHAYQAWRTEPRLWDTLDDTGSSARLQL
ncbi:hypothetical protein Tco_0839221 [Tanacetum coccineum]|uniref:Uncharacterized protein n=1 Tax=Tanacetum coccineum TaxID=301880 RepID=A0ABQ5ARV5_9ASTR